MIGFQSAPAAAPLPAPPPTNERQQAADQQPPAPQSDSSGSPASRRSSASSAASSASPDSSLGSPRAASAAAAAAHLRHLHRRLPQIQQHHPGADSPPLALVSRMNMLGQQKAGVKRSSAEEDEEEDEEEEVGEEEGENSEGAAEPVCGGGEQNGAQRQQSEQTIARAEQQKRLASPGYHSAASSPGASSSVASPVSSSASSAGGSACSASSGISAASLLSSSSPNATGHHLQLHTAGQRPITTTANTMGAGQQHLRQLACGAASLPSLLAAPGRQQHQPIGYAPNRVHQQQHQQQQQPQMHHQHRVSLMAAQQQQQLLLQNANGLNHLLDHFPEAHGDGLNLSWFHEANNRARLNEALGGAKMIVAGDIALAEMSRYPVPIMARPPLGVSDLTLESWLTEVLRARRGIKLTFTSTRAVEPAFRVLARHAEQLKGPLILSADILSRPAGGRGEQGKQGQSQGQQQQPVDAWTFLMLCRTRFPKSIISIGWCGAGAPGAPIEGAPAVAEQPDPAMFELDMMFEQQQQQQQQQQHQFSSPLLHLSQHNHQLHQLQQQRSAHHPGGLQPQQPPQQSILNRQLLQPQRINQCASDGSSLNSSSGNSSGSPSPTSPIGHHHHHLNQLNLNHHHHNHHHQHLNHHNHQHLSHSHLSHLNHHLSPSNPFNAQRSSAQASARGQHSSSAEQLIMAAAAAAAAAASSHQETSPSASSSPGSTGSTGGHWSAMAAAAMVAQLQQQQQQDQLPLNLNINEAEPQHAVSRLNELAQTIQSLQRQSNSLSCISSSLPQQQQQQQAGKPMRPGVPLGQQQKWEHVSKKAALSHRLHTDSPSPISASPKQQSTGPNNLLACASRQQQQQQQQRAPANLVGYTREMIDKMSSLVKEYNLTQAITFPVEARLLVARRNVQFNVSLSELERLLCQVGPNSTLTIVAQPEDLISVEDILLIRKHFAPNQTLFDLPDELAGALRNELVAAAASSAAAAAAAAAND